MTKNGGLFMDKKKLKYESALSTFHCSSLVVATYIALSEFICEQEFYLQLVFLVS